MIENEKNCEIADGWLVLDFHFDDAKYVLYIEYHNGETLELGEYEKYIHAIGYYKKELKKLK
mgnify:CR=1 FL=1